MTKRCPPDLAAFKHEPADYEQPDLIARIEAAEGPNFALECEIFRVVNPQATSQSKPPAYTASLDAAMTLVDLEIGTGGSGHAWYPYLERFTRDLGRTHKWSCWLRRTPDRFIAEATTPALALCAAALKARETPHD